jgi:hypothetical protein
MSNSLDEHQIIISADGHTGPDLCDDTPYLEKKWRDELDARADPFVNLFGDLVTRDATRSWDHEKRQLGLESNGVAAEVLFRNTIPPFFSGGSLIMNLPSPEEYERKWAGLRAHNRWLADFCDMRPGGRAGVAQILVNDIDDAFEGMPVRFSPVAVEA